MLNNDKQIHIDKILRSRRKTLSLEINEKAELIIRAPLRLADSEIKRFLMEKSSWIIQKQKEISRKVFPGKQFSEGEEFLYLGKLYPLHYEGTYAHLFLDKMFYLSPRMSKSAEKQFTKWYRKQAEIVFYERLEHFARLMNIEYNGLKVSSAQKRWGSCTHKNDINLSWRLILAPVEIIDYVVVHELAHVLRKDHSKYFWAIVLRILPDYKERRNWLKDYGHTLNI
ncbi:MAG: M48 family metallopeptidase [Bacteroidetes bacterium]|nr:M48 family metallopeptidase [Bacteroidota bacterium]